MATHETVIHKHKVEPGSDRNFGLVVGGVLVAVACYLFWSGSVFAKWVAVPGFALCVLALVAPASLHLLNIGWTKLGLLLGRIITPIVMFLVYALTVVPIGLLLRLFGKDLLALKRIKEDGSYWINRTPPGPAPESLKDQF